MYPPCSLGNDAQFSARASAIASRRVQLPDHRIRLGDLTSDALICCPVLRVLQPLRPAALVQANIECLWHRNPPHAGRKIRTPGSTETGVAISRHQSRTSRAASAATAAGRPRPATSASQRVVYSLRSACPLAIPPAAARAARPPAGSRRNESRLADPPPAWTNRARSSHAPGSARPGAPAEPRAAAPTSHLRAFRCPRHPAKRPGGRAGLPRTGEIGRSGTRSGAVQMCPEPRYRREPASAGETAPAGTTQAAA